MHTLTVPASEDMLDWKLPALKLGNKQYEGYCLEAEALHVTYQQKPFTFGHISGIAGLVYRGTGGMGGGGGSINTRHESVVTAVIKNRFGETSTIEVPSGVAAMEGARLRLDYINGHMIGVTNNTGKGQLIPLAGPTDFIRWDKGEKTDIALAVISIICLFNGIQDFSGVMFLAAAVFAIRPIMTFIRIRDGKRRLAHFTDYMVQVFSSEHHKTPFA